MRKERYTALRLGKERRRRPGPLVGLLIEGSGYRPFRRILTCSGGALYRVRRGESPPVSIGPSTYAPNPGCERGQKRQAVLENRSSSTVPLSLVYELPELLSTSVLDIRRHEGGRRHSGRSG